MSPIHFPVTVNTFFSKINIQALNNVLRKQKQEGQPKLSLKQRVRGYIYDFFSALLSITKRFVILVFDADFSLQSLYIFTFFKSFSTAEVYVASTIGVMLKLKTNDLSIFYIIILNRPFICFSAHSICYPGTSGKMMLLFIQICQ